MNADKYVLPYFGSIKNWQWEGKFALPAAQDRVKIICYTLYSNKDTYFRLD